MNHRNGYRFLINRDKAELDRINVYYIISYNNK